MLFISPLDPTNRLSVLKTVLDRKTFSFISISSGYKLYFSNEIPIRKTKVVYKVWSLLFAWALALRQRKSRSGASCTSPNQN